MADVTNLTNFLNDVANSIKEKRGYSSEQKIAAANFDTEIANISSGGTNTADATATEGDIIYGMTAYINTGKVTGTLPVPATVNADFSSLNYNYSSGEFHTNAVANVLNKAVVSNITQVSSVIPVDNIFNVLDGSISVGMTNSSLNYNYFSGNILINSNFDPLAEPYHLYDNRKLIIDNATRFYTNIPVDNVFNAIDAAPSLYTVNNLLNFSGGDVIINSNLALLANKQLVDRATVLYTNIPADDILNVIGATPYLAGDIASLNYDMGNIAINVTLDLGSYKTVVDNVTDIGLETSASNILNVMDASPVLYTTSNLNYNMDTGTGGEDFIYMNAPLEDGYPKLVVNSTTYINMGTAVSNILNVLNIASELYTIDNVSNIGLIDNYMYINSLLDTGSYRLVVDNSTYINSIVTQSSIANVINLTPNILKSGETVLGVVGNYSGTDTSDANAVANDIVNGKTAYVNGVKLTGDLNTYNSGEKFEQNITMTYMYDGTNNKLLLDSNPGNCAFKGGIIELSCSGTAIASAANITSSKIVSGETVLGITGTGVTPPPHDSVKLFTSTSAMNSDSDKVLGDMAIVYDNSILTGLYVVTSVGGALTYTPLPTQLSAITSGDVYLNKVVMGADNAIVTGTIPLTTAEVNTAIDTTEDILRN